MTSRLHCFLVLKTFKSFNAICVRRSLAGSFNMRHFLVHDNQSTKEDLVWRTVVTFSSNAAQNCFPSSEKLVARHDPDKFGSQSETSEGDEGDLIEDEHLTYPPSSRLRIKQYADIIKGHLKNKELAKAIAVLEKRMLVEDKAKPDNYLYSLLIGACGRAGYSKKAFHLYNQMKKRGLKVNDAVYTGLFNSCANSPFPDEALKQARHLEGIMIEKGIQPNSTHYNAMIKAHGRCGDVAGAFRLVDEMIDRKIEINRETFSFLFQACITNTEAGFRHALLVWHKMIKRGQKPDVFLFNLLLRCVRDCGLGDLSETEKTFEQLTGGSSGVSIPEESESSTVNVTTSVRTPKASEDSSASIYVGKSDIVPCENGLREAEYPSLSSGELADKMNEPNLLAPIPHLGNLIAVSAVTKPHDSSGRWPRKKRRYRSHDVFFAQTDNGGVVHLTDAVNAINALRLLLLGGSAGFFSCMERFDVLPDIKTVTLLLDCIPPTVSAEKALLSKVKRMGIKLDIDFFNMLIKKRSFRTDYESARDVLRLISTEKLLPDIVTFGVLALGCRTEEEAREVIHNMKCAGFRANEEILGAMLKQACYRYDFKYAMKILYLLSEESIKPSPRFIKIIDDFNEKCREHCRQKVKGEAVPRIAEDPSFKKNMNNFFFKYKAWLDKMGGREAIKDPHPWEQFRKS